MRRLKRRQKVVVGLLIAFIGLPGIAWVVWDLLAGAAVRREIRALEAKGQSMSWDVLAPPGSPEAKNAGVIYQRAFALISEIGSDTENLLLIRVGEEPPWDQEARQRLALYAGEDFNLPALTEEVYWEMARQRLARNKPALDLIEEAAGMEACWFPVNYGAGLAAPMPHLPKFRASARLLNLRARLRVHDGDLPGAYEDIRTILRLERGTRQPALVSCMVGNLLVRHALWPLKTTVAQDDSHPQSWRRLLAELNALDRRPLFATTMQGERAACITTVDAGPSAVASLGTPGASPTIGQRLLWSVGRPVLKYNKARYIGHMTALVEAMQHEPPKALQEIHALEISASSRRQWSDALTCLMAPSLQTVCDSHVACQADRDLARVALALKLHKHEHGAYPESLAALAPGLLEAVPDDPFTGKPLAYTRQGEGFLVYSIGRDLEDNGGNDNPPDPVYSLEGVDIVWKADR